jgi:putative ABC transport system ATP-binding protein
MSLVKAENLTKVYGTGEAAVTALDHVKLEVEAGEFVAIMGPSGCGKSTLLHLLGGLDRPTEGTVSIDGQELTSLSDTALSELRRRKIGFVFQFYNLLPVLNAAENASLPLLLDGQRSAAAEVKGVEWLRKVGLPDRAKHRPSQLSGGQQQRVSVARALVADPSIVLADEPTGNLDTHSSDEIAALLRKVADEWGRAVVMVTHDPRIAAYADRIVFLKDGTIVDEKKLDGGRGAGRDANRDAAAVKAHAEKAAL